MKKGQKYEPELKDRILRLHLEEGPTQSSLTKEYGLGQGTISYWLKQHRKECQSNPQLKQQTDAYEENKRLRRELAEKDKEIAFLKKAAAFFAKEIE
jgi:transposase